MNNMRTNFMDIGEMVSSLEDDDLINHIALRFMISELGKSIMVKVKKMYDEFIKKLNKIHVHIKDVLRDMTL